jgi:DNA-3-methyladenine glycosylase
LVFASRFVLEQSYSLQSKKLTRPPRPIPDFSIPLGIERLVFRNPDVVDAAKNLLGCALFTKIDGHLTGGIITETEAYAGVHDKASHAYGGRRTPRTEVMYRQGGVAYVYLCYGIHALLNVVTGEADTPHGVLIRAIQPTHGIDVMMERRKKTRLDKSLTTGPGALTAALGVTVRYTGTPLNSESLWLNLGSRITTFETTPRIGIDYAEECIDLPYRFVAIAK